MTPPLLLTVGAAHLDRRGRITGDYVPAASNPGTMREEVGGGGFNALRNAVRHKVRGAIFSLRGGDLVGETVARAIQDAGIEDLSATYLDRTTPSYTAILDKDGELIAGFADMALYELGFARQMRRRSVRDAVERADAVLCEANMPAVAIAALIRISGTRPVYAIAISPAKVERLSSVLASLSCLFMNMREARVLAGLETHASVLEAARILREKGLRRGLITAGSAPLTGFDEQGLFTIACPQSLVVRDVTGAGDAIAGATTAALMNGTPFREAARHGVAAARLTVESATVVASYEDDVFASALALVAPSQAVV
jgi:pseudouridine kinase